MRIFFRLLQYGKVMAMILVLFVGAVFALAQDSQAQRHKQQQQRTSAPPDVPLASQQLT